MISVKKLKELGYPHNLMFDMGVDEPQEPPKDFVGTIDYMTATTLTAKEHRAIELRYKQCLTLEGIGNELGTLKERARQILAKAVRKLRHPSRLRIILMGLDACCEARLQEVRETAYYEGYARGQSEQNGASGPDCEAIRKSMLCKPIEELNLSVRSYNCLKRAEKTTVGDIYDTPYSELLRVRNLGKKSLQEIEQKMTEMGLPLKSAKTAATLN